MAFQTNYNVGGVVDIVKRIPRIDEIGRISAFPEFKQPYNEMIMQEIPAIAGAYEMTFNMPNVEVEILCVTLTCSGYGKGDYFNMWCNGVQWFKNWYTNEVKEGLFLGTSTFAYRAPANTVMTIEFNNVSATSKTVWVGFRMLVQGNEATV